MNWKVENVKRVWIPQNRWTKEHWNTHTHTHLSAHRPFQPCWRSGKRYRWPFARNQQLSKVRSNAHIWSSNSLGCPPTNTSFISFIFALPSPSLFFRFVYIRHVHTHTHTHTHTHWPSHPHRKRLIFGEYVWKRQKEKSCAIPPVSTNQHLSLSFNRRQLFKYTLSVCSASHLWYIYVTELIAPDTN